MLIPFRLFDRAGIGRIRPSTALTIGYILGRRPPCSRSAILLAYLDLTAEHLEITSPGTIASVYKSGHDPEEASRVQLMVNMLSSLQSCLFRMATTAPTCGIRNGTLLPLPHICSTRHATALGQRVGKIHVLPKVPSGGHLHVKTPACD